MSSSLSALEQINMLSAFRLIAGSRCGFKTSWRLGRRGVPSIDPLLNRPLPPFPGLEAFLPTEESNTSPRPITGQHTPFPANMAPHDQSHLKAAANIIGRPFTKAGLNWVMAALWPDSVDHLRMGNKRKGQANTVSQYISMMKRSGDSVLYQSAFVIGWFWWMPSKVHHCNPGNLFYEASPKDTQDE